MEEAVRSLAREQARCGHSVRVVTLNRLFHGDGTTLPLCEVLDGIEVRRVPFFGSQRYSIAFGIIPHIRDADILHMHGVDFLFDYLALTSDLHKKKMVVSTHGGYFHTEYLKSLKKIFFHTATRLLVSRYGYIAASSHQDEETFRRLREGGIGVVENGVDISKFKDCASQSLKRVIISFGRLAPNKNTAALFPFLKTLRDRDGPWQLIVAGSPGGTSLEELCAAAAMAGVADAVEFVVSPTDAELRKLISRSSAFASASRYEGFGIAAIEALSAGLLPALSDIPPHRRTREAAGIGVLLDFSDPAVAAEKFLASWREWCGCGGALRARALRSVECFSWPRVARRFEGIYNAVRGRTARKILDVSVRVTDARTLVATIDDAIDRREPLRLAFLNANLANIARDDSELCRRLQDFFVINDGVGVNVASRLLYARRFPQNLNGTDFTPFFLENTRHRLKIFLLGARPDVVRRANDLFRARWPRHTVVGSRDGFFSTKEEAEVAEEIRATKPNLLLVGMGNPRQEYWIAEHAPDVCPCAFAVGALFDFLSGEVRRAPNWVRLLGCEWMFRLALEPQRLSRRYLVGNFIFLARVIGQLIRGDRA